MRWNFAAKSESVSECNSESHTHTHKHTHTYHMRAHAHAYTRAHTHVHMRARTQTHTYTYDDYNCLWYVSRNVQTIARCILTMMVWGEVMPLSSVQNKGLFFNGGWTSIRLDL